MLQIEKRSADHFEQVVVGTDHCTGLHAIIAVHSTALGPSLGGVRMQPYVDEAAAEFDVLRLAWAMTRKAAISRLPLGGGKAVVIGDHTKDKSRDLMLALGEMVESLDGAYIAAEDAGINCKDIDIVAERTEHRVGVSTASGDPGVSTAHGVRIGIERLAKRALGGEGLDGITVAIQGVGSVGMHLAEMLHARGAKLIVADVNQSACDYARDKFDATVTEPAVIHTADCDVYAPCALGGGLNPQTIPNLKCRAIAGGANNQLLDEVTDAQALLKRGIVYAPDYLLNAGGLIRLYVLEILSESQAELDARLDAIGDSLDEVLDRAETEGETPAAIAQQVADERVAAAANNV